LSAITIFISALGEFFNIGATYSKINPITKELDPYLVTIKSLFNVEGIRYIFGNITNNFIGFVPLITMLIGFIGIGVVEKSGLLNDFIKKVTSKLNKRLITFLLILVSIISTINIDSSYVFLLPFGALLFYLNGRNPLVGIITAFAGITFGSGANLIIGNTDINIIRYTSMAANVIDSKYQVGLFSNIFISIITIFIMSWLGMIITEKYIVPKVGRYQFENIENIEEIIEVETNNNKKKIIMFTFFTIIMLGMFIYLFIPGFPYSGILLDNNEIGYFNKLFGYDSYFKDALLIMITLLLIIAGILYGYSTNKFKKHTDIIDSMNNYMGIAGYSIATIFFAAQFINIFKKTNIDTVIVAFLTGIIKSIGFTGLPLIIIVFILIAIISLFMTSSTIKWSIIAPTMIPTLMQANISPEFSQTIYKAGDSIGKGLTPLFAYFVVYLCLLNYYNKDKEHPITISKALSYTLPYSIIFMVMWLFIIISWYIIGLPIGIGISPTV
jgi:aminobenzoyl-glutamate transport protein